MGGHTPIKYLMLLKKVAEELAKVGKKHSAKATLGISPEFLS